MANYNNSILPLLDTSKQVLDMPNKWNVTISA